MKYNSHNSDSESVKLPIASSPEEDFSTPLRTNFTLTPSTLTFKVEAEPSKTSLETKFTDMMKSFSYGLTSSQSKRAAKKSEVNSPFSAEREAKITEERMKAAAEFPNPMDNTFPPSQPGGQIITIEENEQWDNIPPNIDPDQNKELAYKNLIRSNVLKGQRRAFYTTITKVKNRIMKATYDASPQEGKDLQAKCKETFNSLTNITQELGTYAFQNTPQEVKSFTKYFSDLRTLMHKIENIVDAEHNDELREAFLNMYLMEEDAFSKGVSVEDLEVDFNQTLGAGANSTKFKWNPKPKAAEIDDDDGDDIIFKDSRTKQPTDSDYDEETFRENTGASKSFYSEPQFNSHQGAYTPNATFPPNLNNPPTNQGNPGGQGGPGGQPPMPPGGGQPPNYNWGAPPPNLRQQQQQQQWAGQPQQYPYYPQQPTPNYQGIKKIQVEKFDGSEETYKRFKLKFASAYVKKRKNQNIPDSDLALILNDSLKGDALDLINKYLNNCNTDISYRKMWKLLEERYGGQNVEDAHVIINFKSAHPLRNTSMKELERVLDVISIQYEFYRKYDPASLQSERSLLFQTAKEKLSQEFSMKFVRHCTRYNYIPNFISLEKFLKAEFLIAQTTEREFRLTRLSKFNRPHARSKNYLQNRHLQDGDDDDEKYDQRDGQNDYSQDDDSTLDGIDGLSQNQFAFFIHDTRNGQRLATNDFRHFQSLGHRSYGNQDYIDRNPNYQEGAQKALGEKPPRSYRGYRGPKSPPPHSQYEEGKCSCCKQAHNLLNCPKFKTLKPTLQAPIIRRDTICYHCLIGVHYAKDCETDKGKKCGVDECDRYHHKILHRVPKSDFSGKQVEEEVRPK
jgi:hypothetical protein